MSKGSEVKLYQRNVREKVRTVFKCKKKGCQTLRNWYVKKKLFLLRYVDANG